jgi:phospholipid transport system substrate-binding protein
MNRRLFLMSTAAAAATVLLPFGAFAQATEGAAFVADFTRKGLDEILMANIPNTEKQKRFRDMFKTYFDIPGIGRFVLARYIKAAQPADLEKFNTLFEDVIVYTWSRRFSEYNGQTLQVTGQQPDGDGMLVKSTINGANNTHYAVDWRLRKRAEGLKVLDIIVEGVSMAITYRQDYSTVISQTGNFSGLLAQMEKQVTELKAQQPA